ncbi:MAG: serine/threonine protein kinase [Candidatus Obscuribacterales bacterium]|nr:serine/threonine protein kinase [Candidatus Obscuribacterales bacterium]
MEAITSNDKQVSGHHSAHIGALLDSRFEVRSLLGKGGLSWVYRGIDQSNNTEVAIKILKSQFSDEDAAGRFARETRAASLSHPNLVKVLDRGIKDSGEPFIVMELLEGRTLAEVLADSHGRLRLPRVINICRQAAEGVAFAHKDGIVHRDLKPGNIFLVSNSKGKDQVKVLDFGLAKVMDQSTGFQTRVDETVGTPKYMSPEQIMGERVDGRSDIYSLCVVLFELVTGECLYDGETPFEVMTKHTTAPPVDPRQVRADLRLPDDLCELVMKGLSKYPGERFQTMSGLETALRRLEIAHPPSKIDHLLDHFMGTLATIKSKAKRT